MNSVIKKKRNLFIRLAAGVLSVVFMTLTAELLGEYEIIFPELAALSLGAVISERTGIIKEFPDNEKHLSFGEEFGRLFFVTAVLAAVTAAAIFGGWTYMIAPPLIVAFSEISYPDSLAGKKPIILIFSVISCALCGTVSRLVLCEVTGLPLCIGVLAAAAAAYGLLMLFELPFPPAAALAVLPFILSEDVLGAYPFQAAAGIIIFTVAAVIYACIRVGHGSGGKKESDLLL